MFNVLLAHARATPTFKTCSQQNQLAYGQRDSLCFSLTALRLRPFSHLVPFLHLSLDMSDDRDGQQLLLFGDEVDDLVIGGMDDMNILEILIGLPGRRRPPKGKTISVPWDRGDRSYYVEYNASTLSIEWESPSRDSAATRQFYIEVKTPDSVGLPKSRVEDVFVALLKLTADAEFDDAEIRTNRLDLLTMMRWPTNGKYYKHLDQTLNQLVHLTVETNALWDPAKERYFKSTFNILDSADREEPVDAGPAELVIRWASKMMDVFGRGYMKRLDTDFFYSLNSSTTKRIYRWLDKHLTFYPVVEIDVLRFAHKVLGYGVSYEYPSQVVQNLEPWLDELYDQGFCRWEVKPSQSDSKKKFVFTRVTMYRSVLYPRRDYVIEALEDRGVGRSSELVDTYGWERCLRQIEYHDFRGDDIADSGAWLRRAVEQNFDLPDTLSRLIEQAKEETARWCNRMYEGLSLEEQGSIEREIDAVLGDDDRNNERLRRRTRNHILLSRRKQL